MSGFSLFLRQPWHSMRQSEAIEERFRLSEARAQPIAVQELTSPIGSISFEG